SRNFEYHRLGNTNVDWGDIGLGRTWFHLHRACQLLRVHYAPHQCVGITRACLTFIQYVAIIISLVIIVMFGGDNLDMACNKKRVMKSKKQVDIT
ncbi:hypothetical protein CR513_47981, partial [Mucuna pruriens]